MPHVFLAVALALLAVASSPCAAEEDVPVPVPGLHSADPELPGADKTTSQPEAPPPPPPPSTTNVAPSAPRPATTNLPPGRTASSAEAYPPNTVFTVQLGAFQSRERAFALYWELSKKISPLQVTAPSARDKLYRVRYGSYPNYAEAKAAADKIKARGIDCFVAALSPEGENVTTHFKDR